MKVEKRGNSYRVQPRVNGKRLSITFDYKPSQKDIADAISRLAEDYDKKDSFGFYARQYVDNRQNVLSPSSVRTYDRLIKALSKEFRDIPLREITQDHVQAEINNYAVKHAPKTVRALHGFIASVIGVYRPSLTLHTTLPQKVYNERYLPTESDIKALLKATENTEDHIAIQLGILSLRRSEICALEMSDLNGNELHVHANLVYNKKWEKKESPKTDAGNRIIYLPDSLVKEIREKGYFFKYSPQKISDHIHKYQKELGIPYFRFHDLRHYFASYASTIMPESDAMALGGWKSDFVFKNTYRASMKEKRKESAGKYLDDIFNTSVAPKNAPINAET